MGHGMAPNLAKFLANQTQGGNPAPATPSFGPVLRIWNRDASKCADLVQAHGCQQCTSLQELAASCTIIHTCLAQDDALKQVVGVLLPAAQPGTIVVDHSTVLPETTQALADAAAQAGCSYVHAPVFGRPDAAAAARLITVASGPPAALARVHPLLAAMSRKVMDLGSNPTAATAMKLSGNFCIASCIEMLGEGMTLAEKNGVGRAHFMEWFAEFFSGPGITGYGHRIAADDFHAGQGFTVELGLKDVGHMRRMAATSDTPLPLADLAFNHLLQARAAGHGSSDWGAIALGVRQSAGLPIPAPALPK